MGNFDRGNRSGGGGGRGFGRPRSSGGRSFGGGSRDFGNRGDREMHHAVCSNCGKDCEVPFRPTGSKPVLCSDCFAKNRDSEPRRYDDRAPRRDFAPREGGGQNNNRQLDVINAKLDQVLALLNGAPKGKPARQASASIAGGAPKSPKVVKEAKVEAPVPTGRQAKEDTSSLDVSDILETGASTEIDPNNSIDSAPKEE